MGAYNSFFYVFGLVLFGIVIWLLVKYINKQHYPPTDSFYYQIEDVDGNKSIIHNSGIKPSETIPGSSVSFSILKKSYNDGNVKICNLPKKVYIGYHPKELKEHPFINIEETDDLFKIEIKCPSDNPFYHKIKTD